MLKPLAGPLSNDHWYPMMYINGGGLTHRWFSEEIAEQSNFQTLDKGASQIPEGADNLLFIPHFMGRTCPVDTSMRGAFLGLSWTHKKAHMYRAVLESIAYDFAAAINAIKHYLPAIKLNQVRVIGGGAQSQLWNQIKANVLGVPYVRLERDAIAPWGSAIMAGHAVGLFDDMAKTAQESVTTLEKTEPNQEAHLKYQDYVAAYQQALVELKGVNENLAVLRARK